MKYTVDQQSLNKVLKNFQNKSDLALEKCWEYLKAKIKDQIYVDSYDLWDLYKSIESRKVRSWLVEVWSAKVYAPVREYGRQPGKFPPFQSLVGRTARKKIIKWWPTSNYENLHYTDKGKIFLIARAIAVKGIKGKHTFQTVVDRERENIKKFYIEFMKIWL